MQRLFRLVERAVLGGAIRYREVTDNQGNATYGISAEDFIDWCEVNQQGACEELVVAVRQICFQAEPSRDSGMVEGSESHITDSGVRELGTRERDSLLKMVIGMAVRGYGYDPTAARSKTASEIATDLQHLGLSLDEDTIRKYLEEGKELLPRDETE